MKPYNFLYTCDKKYFPHLLTSIYSLAISHIEDDITIHIIEEDFGENEYHELEKIMSICQNIDFKFYPFSQIREKIQKLQIPNWRGSGMANARLFARELLPNLEEVLYIDSDTIIENNLTEIFNQEEKHPLSAVKESTVPLRMQKCISSYYNSGVILFNYPKWDQEDCLSTLYETTSNNMISLCFPDQDILNLALSDKIKSLDISYNITPTIYSIMQYPYLAKQKFKDPTVFYSYEEIKASLNKPHIYHLLGTVHGRPWDKANANPFKQLYEDYRRLWDPTFQMGNDKVLLRNKTLSFLNVLCTTCLPDPITQQIKNKVRQKLIKK